MPMMAPGAMPEAGHLSIVACRPSCHLSNCIQGLVDSLFAMHCFVLCCRRGQQFCLGQVFRCASCEYALSVGPGAGDSDVRCYSFTPNCRCKTGDKSRSERAIGCQHVQIAAVPRRARHCWPHRGRAIKCRHGLSTMKAVSSEFLQMNCLTCCCSDVV